MPTVGIVEDHRLTRIGIEQVLARSPQLEVVLSVGSADQVALAAPAPDVIVLDLAQYPAESALRVIGALSVDSAVLVISPSGERGELLAALTAGAHGCVTRHTDDAEFLTAVEMVARGGFYLAAGLAPHLRFELGRRAAAESQVLTRREVETLRLIADGYTHGQIASRLGLTAATVNTYVKRVRAKLNAGNKAELTRKAIELGYLAEHGPAARAHGALRSAAVA
ncbi:LuxR C-terminal-related transcriptional regulator [Kitasatospora sp. NPDC058965]|uniref:LuxR C-terminal-related transcriptional regulator n=1 Tax=Kitasatospora sp. NPDC058965 TaxID=3346682 RepID=UPI00369DCF1A